jgi:hypothetical protein
MLFVSQTSFGHWAKGQHKRPRAMQDGLRFMKRGIECSRIRKVKSTIFKPESFCLCFELCFIAASKDGPQIFFDSQVSDELACVTIRTIDKKRFHFLFLSLRVAVG